MYMTWAQKIKLCQKQTLRIPSDFQKWVGIYICETISPYLIYVCKIPYKWSEGLERLPQSDQTDIRRIS